MLQRYFSIAALTANFLCVQTAVAEAERTVITSRTVEMTAGEAQNVFVFEEDVTVRGNNLTATCDHLVVTSNRLAGDGGSDDAGRAEIGSIATIVMTGNVVIEQGNRRATAGRAEVLPSEGRVVLEDNPVVRDVDGTAVSGWKMILHKDQRRVQILSDPQKPETRTRITLDALPDLGYERDEGGRSEDQRDKQDREQ